MEAIVKWLENKDYEEGVRLYDIHGSSSFLKKLFKSGETDYSRNKLEEELNALSPVIPERISPQSLEFDVIPEGRKRSIVSDWSEKALTNTDNIQYLKLIRRRDELNRQISRNMVLLDVSVSKARRFETAKQIITLDRSKREVWAEIDYFMEHGALMPAAVRPQIKTDELQRLYVNIYKAEKRLENPTLRNREKTEKLLAEKRRRVEEIRKERAGE